MTEAKTRRQELADTAITILARIGMRGLTHRAVDRAADLSEGSTSYYFRTRQALLEAAVERLAEVDAAELLDRPALSGEAELDEVADAVAELVEQWVTSGRDRMLSRYELALEANRRPELREVLAARGARFRELAAAMLAASGAPDSARQAPLLVAYIDGLIFDHLAGAGGLKLSRHELKDAASDLLRACVSTRRKRSGV